MTPDESTAWTQVASLRAQLSEKEAELVALRDERAKREAIWLGRLKAEDDRVERLTREHNAQLAAKDAEIARLKKERESARDDAEYATGALVKECARANKANAEIAALHAEKQKFSQDMDRWQREADAHHAECSAEIAALRGERDAALNKVSICEVEQHASRIRLGTAENKRLVDELTESRAAQAKAEQERDEAVEIESLARRQRDQHVARAEKAEQERDALGAKTPQEACKVVTDWPCPGSVCDAALPCAAHPATREESK